MKTESAPAAPAVAAPPNIDYLVLNHFDHRSVIELARASLRFEALCRATPVQFAAIFQSVLLGAKLDGLVDMMVIDMHTDKMKQ